MSREALRSTISERAQGGFASLQNLALRTKVSQPILENLFRVGALDSFGAGGELLKQAPEAMRLKGKAGRKSGLMFKHVDKRAGSLGKPIRRERITRMLAERELFPVSLSAHPLDFRVIDKNITRMKDLPTVATGRTVNIVGSVILFLRCDRSEEVV